MAVAGLAGFRAVAGALVAVAVGSAVVAGLAGVRAVAGAVVAVAGLGGFRAVVGAVVAVAVAIPVAVGIAIAGLAGVRAVGLAGVRRRRGLAGVPGLRGLAGVPGWGGLSLRRSCLRRGRGRRWRRRGLRARGLLGDGPADLALNLGGDLLVGADDDGLAVGAACGRILGDQQLAGVDATRDRALELLLARGRVCWNLEVQIGVGRDGVQVNLGALRVDQFVLKFAGQLESGLAGLEPDRTDLALGAVLAAGEGDIAGLGLDGRLLALLQSGVGLPGQVGEQLLGAGRRRLVGVRQAQPLVIVGEVPDGCLGGGDGLLLSQAGDAAALDELGHVGLGVAALGDPGDLGLYLGVVLELVGAREVLPVADAEIGFVLDVDVELDAVGLNGAFLARRGVHGEQVGLDVAGGAVLPRKVQLEAGYALVVRADLRVSLRVTVRVVLGMCHGRAKGKGRRKSCGC